MTPQPRAFWRWLSAEWRSLGRLDEAERCDGAAEACRDVADSLGRLASWSTWPQVLGLILLECRGRKLSRAERGAAVVRAARAYAAHLRMLEGDLRDSAIRA